MKPAPLALTRRGAGLKAAPISLCWSPPTGHSLPVLGDTETRSMQPHRAALLLLACLLAVQGCAAPAARAVEACQLEKRQAGGGRPAGLLHGQARTLPTFGAAAAGCDGVTFLLIPACSAAPQRPQSPGGASMAAPIPSSALRRPAPFAATPARRGQPASTTTAAGAARSVLFPPLLKAPSAIGSRTGRVLQVQGVVRCIVQAAGAGAPRPPESKG